MLYSNGDDKYNSNVVTINNVDGTSDNYKLYYKTTAFKLYVASVIIDRYNATKVLSSEDYKMLVSMLWIVSHTDTAKAHSKLAGLKSLSTCCIANKYCIARMQRNDSICKHCYAAAQQNRQYGLTDHNMINLVILKNVVIPVDFFRMLPIETEKFFRIESFGDIENATQAQNYINLMRAFPGTTFAVWTKNDSIWQKVFAVYGKPCNCVYIMSSLMLNKPIATKEKRPALVNHVFTVYDRQAAAKVKINCGGRRCMDCIRNHKGCYYTDTDFSINELLK